MLEGNKILLRIVEQMMRLYYFMGKKPENKKVTNVDRPIDLFLLKIN